MEMKKSFWGVEFRSKIQIIKLDLSETVFFGGVEQPGFLVTGPRTRAIAGSKRQIALVMASRNSGTSMELVSMALGSSPR